MKRLIVILSVAAVALVPVTGATGAIKPKQWLGVVSDPWHSDEWSAALEAPVGVVGLYRSFGTGWLPSEFLAEAKERRLRLFINWMPRAAVEDADPNAVQPRYSNKAIARGRHDVYIKAFARALAEYRSSVLVYLRYAPEFNGPWSPWHVEPEWYVKAWKRVYRIFRNNRATNVKFVWSPALPWQGYPVNEWRVDVRKYWPGPKFVHLVDTTTVSHDGQEWRYFADRLYLLREFRKPISLGEVHAPEPLRDDFLRQVSAWVAKRKFVRTVVWLDIPPEPSLMESPHKGDLAAFAR